MREAQWAKQGYLHVNYDGMSARKPRRVTSDLFDDVLSDVSILLLSALETKRGRIRDDRPTGPARRPAPMGNPGGQRIGPRAA